VHINRVTLRQARLVLRWVTDHWHAFLVCMQAESAGCETCTS